MPIFQMSTEAWRDSVTRSRKVMKLHAADLVSRLPANASPVTSQLMEESLGRLGQSCGSSSWPLSDLATVTCPQGAPPVF